MVKIPLNEIYYRSDDTIRKIVNHSNPLGRHLVKDVYVHVMNEKQNYYLHSLNGGKIKAIPFEDIPEFIRQLFIANTREAINELRGDKSLGKFKDQN